MRKKIITLSFFSLLILAFIFFKTNFFESEHFALEAKDFLNKELPIINIKNDIKIEYLDSHPLVDAARRQIGVVVKYDSSYYQGGYPPEDRGACTDLVERALRDSNYMLKELLDKDMLNNPDLYPQDYDPNINFRRVRNLKIFFDRHAEKLSTCVTESCFKDGTWQAGDIVTYEQIPGGLWHIAIISNKVTTNNSVSIPYIIHNHGRGAVENNLLLFWPAPISGHYRINKNQLN